MGAPTPDDRPGAVGAGDDRQRRVARGVDRGSQGFDVVDRLADSFPLMPGESQWLMALLADDLARILADD